MRCSIPRDYRINDRIRVSSVLLVGESGEQLGVLETSEAFKIAQDRGYDLVEVAPSANPPVCRLMDYGKFRYEITRKEREARKARPTASMREVRMRTRIREHDRLSKTRLTKRLLGQGSKVKVSVMFRGREMEHSQIGMELLKTVAEDLIDDALLERPPSFEGRFLSMVLAPMSEKNSNKKKGDSKEIKSA